MSRTLKNIIMIIMLVVVLLLTVTTVYKATDERVTVGTGTGGDPNGMGAGGEMMGTMVGENLVLDDGTTFFPDGTGVRPDGTPLTQEEINELMPAGPEGGMGTPPDAAPGGMGTPPDAAPGGMGGGGAEPTQTTIDSLNKIYYVYFGVESLVFLLILAFLILSKFNKKSFGETFDDKLKFILLAIIAIFGTAILTYACSFISDVAAEKMAETKEAASKENNPSETTPETDTNTGTGTTDPNAGTVPEGGEVTPEQNQDAGAVDPNAGAGTPPTGEVGGVEVTPEQNQDAGAVDPNTGAGTPPTGVAGGETTQSGNPAEGGDTPSQMP